MKKLKKLLLLICVLTCLFAMTACGVEKKEEKFSKEYSAEELVDNIVSNTETVVDFTDKEFETAMEQYNEDDETESVLLEGLKQIKNAKEESGEYEGFYFDDNNKIEYTISETKDSITVSTIAKFEKRDVKIEYTFGFINETFSITSMRYESVYSMSEKMKNAGLNTVIGMSIVVVVLIFLSILISLFKYVNLAESKLKERKENKNKKNEVTVNSAFDNIESKEDVVDESDDLELVAVITAAIAASQQTPAEGFVVRSIKRIPGKKWNRGI